MRQMTSENSPVRTACFEEHVALGGNIVDFHGFELPIWYSNIKQEHLNTRQNAGLFDVSHMGTFVFSGTNVRKWMQSIATQKIENIDVGRCAYTHFLDENGHIIDDMIFAITADDEIIGVPNASMVEVMLNWFTKHLPKDGSVEIKNLTDSMSILALQGPKSPEILESVLGLENVVAPFRWRRITTNDLGLEGWIQGTGYTGERGFEIFVPNEFAVVLWRSLIKKGSDWGMCPVGLGARDTLRLEKGYLLSGQDFCWPRLSDEIEGIEPSYLARNSWETNVPFGLSLEHDFLGKESVVSSSQNPESQRWWGIKYQGRGPLPRTGKEVGISKRDTLPESAEDIEVLGYITSGVPSPSLDNLGIGMTYLSGVKEGDLVYIVASKTKLVPALIVKPPFI
tara:strand:- start:474 stop:1661 length:1188 start_codon:yes stop_codon:yes gene_type:complete